ncbi:MAG: HupE/UreJ family protein, partial [Myxococcota bacterium]
PQPPAIDDGWLRSRRSVTCTHALDHAQVIVDGLAGAPVDVVVTVRQPDGTETRRLLTGTRPQLPLVESGTAWTSFFALGIVHLLEGLDHGLLVVGLALLLGPTWRLLRALTAFTLGHSVTLAVVALGGGGAAPLVEVGIALSLVWLALELVGEEERSDDDPPGFLVRWPDALGAGIGLLHGAGFGGALVELGLPRSDVVGALFLFNVGIEVGQLVVVAGLGLVLAVVPGLRRMGRIPVAYLIGALALAWTFERAWGLL